MTADSGHMTSLDPYLHYRCDQCGGDGWALASRAACVLCSACGAPMRCTDVMPEREVAGPPIWVDSHPVTRGWLGGK